MRIRLLAVLLIFWLIPVVALAEAWKIDPDHSSAGFAVRHLMVTTVRGTIQGIKGKVDLDEKKPTASMVDVTLDTATLSTQNKKRDEHLKGPDFLDVKKYPTIRFVSTKITKAGKDWKVTGDLTIRGVTKPVTLKAQVTEAVASPFGTTVRGVEATTTIKRSAFGMTWNKSLDKGGVLVGDDVEIQINLELQK
ncbi:MAG: YceI family protein [Myxococcales bacterium]|nr:YceI family protein [Myxococcales bacterium]